MKFHQGKPEDVGMSRKRIDHVRDLAGGWVADGHTPSLVIFAARKGVIVLHEAFGHQGPGNDSPALAKDAIFWLASISKPITATAAMTLVDDGLLALNRPVSDYIPEFIGEGKDDVLVHHLLTHTSGLNDEVITNHIEKNGGDLNLPSVVGNHSSKLEKDLEIVFSAPLEKPPGKEMTYSDYGYRFLGEIINRISGSFLAKTASEKIFKPLGMKNTYYGMPDSIENKSVKIPVDAHYYESHEQNKKIPSASGGAYSNALDIGKFGQMFLNSGEYGGKRILSPLTIHEMTRNQIPGIGSQYFEEYFPEAAWGYGWSIQGEKKAPYFGSMLSPKSFWHPGYGGVYLWVDPISEIVGVYFSVELEIRSDGGHKWNADLLLNAVTAAVIK